MSRRDRWLLRGTAGLVLLHALAAWLAPGSLWGVSHLAVWPPALQLVWTLGALAALAIAPRRAAAASRRAFPTAPVALALAIAAAVPFWLLRERTHWFGDGALLVRDRGFSETVTRAPLLVRVAVATVALGDRAGAPVATSLALLSILAGVAAVFAALRLAATLSADGGDRFLAAALLLCGGGMALFFGHVEYYALPAAALLAYLWLACRGLERGAPLWPTWLAFGILLPLHLSMLALAPAQVFLTCQAWRRGERRASVAAIAASVALAWGATRLAGGGGRALAGTAWGGLGRYLEPFFDTATSRHAFGFLSPAHLLALANDLLLVAPMALVASAAILVAARPRRDPVVAFLGVACVGCLALDIVFNRELGPYRDWDILAPCGFVYLSWAAACLVRPHPGSQRVAIVAALVGGLFHLVPWIALQVSPRTALAHAQIVLATPNQWSPHARGYLYEEIAIWERERGDAAASLRAYEAAVAAHPGDARFHVGLGTRWAERADWERAAAEFETALRLRPDYAPAHNDLAYVLAVLGRDLDVARRHAETALRGDPDNADYHMTLARVARRAGDVGAARAAAAAAVRLRPGDRAATALLDTLGGAP